MTNFFLVLVVVGLLLGVFSMLYGTERAATPTQPPHERHSEHNPAAEPSPVFNASSIAASLFACGLAGYLLARNTALSAGTIIGIAVGTGVAAFVLQSLLIAKWAIPSARADHVDERFLLQGTIGTVTSPIPIDGEGAIRYALEGREYLLPARNVGSGAVAAGTEIVVDRIEGGIAYVELWTQVEERL